MVVHIAIVLLAAVFALGAVIVSFLVSPSSPGAIVLYGVATSLGAAGGYSLLYRFLSLESLRQSITSESAIIEIRGRMHQIGEMIRERIPTDEKAEAYETREQTYFEVPRVIARVAVEEPGRKQLLLGAFHSATGSPRVSSPSELFAEFDKAMSDCIMSSGPGSWAVREMFNITTKQRLDMIKQHLANTEGADNFEVRTFSDPDAIPGMSPLIVGRRHVFLAIEDPQLYRVSKCLHVDSRTAVDFVTEYFETLWNDSRILILRARDGNIRWDVIEALEAKLDRV
jgi:hypothetical protein